MFEELREIKDPLLKDNTLQALTSLHLALKHVVETLKFGHESSKLFMVLERKQAAGKFHSVTTQLEQALSELAYVELGLSNEVREQVELVHAVICNHLIATSHEFCGYGSATYGQPVRAILLN